MKKYLLAFILLWSACCFAQCSPFMGIGNVQFFDNTGNPLVNGVLYSYQAGTSTQQSTFTSSSCGTPNVNPLSLGIGGRVQIWLTSTLIYKFVLCAQNDGPACSAGDVLFSVDQVPGGATLGSGGGSPFIGIFISGSSLPASSGIIRLAANDLECWRNAANSGNLCWSKDSNDLLTWAGGTIKLQEGPAPNSFVGYDILQADSTAHRFLECVNGNSQCFQIVVSTVNGGLDGRDLNGDTVTQLHFGTSPAPLNSSMPNSNQALIWDGSHISGATITESTFTFSGNGGVLTVACTSSPNTLPCAQTVLSLNHTLVRFTYVINIGGAGCSISAVVGVRDVTSSTNLYTTTVPPGGSATFVDSGALSVAMTGGHTFLIGVLTAASGCSTSPSAGWMTMVYE